MSRSSDMAFSKPFHDRMFLGARDPLVNAEAIYRPSPQGRSGGLSAIEKSFPAGYEVARSTRRTLCRLAPADCRANQTC